MNWDHYGYPIFHANKRVSLVARQHTWQDLRQTATSDDDFSQLGRWVIERYERSFTIHQDNGTDREISGLEMIAMHAARRELACEKRERDGCCGDISGVEGRCYGCGGWCVQVEEARQAEAFCVAFLKWLEPKDEDDDDDND